MDSGGWKPWLPRGGAARLRAAARGAAAADAPLPETLPHLPLPPQQWHPDRHRGEDCGAAQRRFQEIQEAYESERGGGAGGFSALRPAGDRGAP